MIGTEGRFTCKCQWIAGFPGRYTVTDVGARESGPRDL